MVIKDRLLLEVIGHPVDLIDLPPARIISYHSLAKVVLSLEIVGLLTLLLERIFNVM